MTQELTAFCLVWHNDNNDYRKDVIQIKFEMPDGKVIAGRAYADIVRGMADEKFTPAQNIERYRRKLAERVSGLYDITVDASTDKSLVTSLEEVGLIARLA